MFVTDLVRNLAWSLRQSRQRMSGQDSVMPADAIAAIKPTRRDPSRPGAPAPGTPQRRRDTSAAEPERAVSGEANAADHRPHIDVEV